MNETDDNSVTEHEDLGPLYESGHATELERADRKNRHCQSGQTTSYTIAAARVVLFRAERSSGNRPRHRLRYRADFEMIKKLDKKQNLGNFLAAVQYLDSHPMCTGKIGVVGFCWAGATANQLAVHSQKVDAAVPYYGRQPAAEDVPKIKAFLLLHYAGLDERINKGIPAYESALKAAGVNYQIYTYEAAKHAFNNDTNLERYNKEAAELAWQRTISFFKEKLKTP